MRLQHRIFHKDAVIKRRASASAPRRLRVAGRVCRQLQCACAWRLRRSYGSKFKSVISDVRRGSGRASREAVMSAVGMLSAKVRGELLDLGGF